MKLSSPLHLFSIFFSIFFLSTSSNPSPHCPSHCGTIPITYPFGLGPNCSLPGFSLSCQSHHPFLSHLQVLNISNSRLRVDSTPFIASDCKSGHRTLSRISIPSPFVISSAANRFVAVGCDTVAIISDSYGRSTGGCVSVCSGGSGFCEAVVPEGRRVLSLGVGNMFGYKNVSGGGNCSYGFVAEKEEEAGEFKEGMSIAMSLDWEIEGDGAKCFECGKNGYCLERTNGYLCYCLQGFAGNPYLNGSNGCQGNRT